MPLPIPWEEAVHRDDAGCDTHPGRCSTPTSGAGWLGATANRATPAGCPPLTCLHWPEKPLGEEEMRIRRGEAG